MGVLKASGPGTRRQLMAAAERLCYQPGCHYLQVGQWPQVIIGNYDITNAFYQACG